MGALRVNETKITAENAFNPDHLWMEGKHESENLAPVWVHPSVCFP